jgi:hypothetical protein
MATLRVFPERIVSNIRALSGFLAEHEIQWTLVAKLLGGDEDVLRSLLSTRRSKACIRWRMPACPD